VSKGRAKYYSSLDLASGYWQVEVDPKDVPKTAFSTRVGTFAYLRMPMGLKNASIAFQRFMTEIFSDLLYRGVLVFIYDILIYSKTWSEHLKLVDEVLRRLKEHNPQAKVSKCHFGAKEIKYLGSIVPHKCRKPDPEKVKAIRELQTPQSKDDIKRFKYEECFIIKTKQSLSLIVWQTFSFQFFEVRRRCIFRRFLFDFSKSC